MDEKALDNGKAVNDSSRPSIGPHLPEVWNLARSINLTWQW